jgi:hypothetical protein
MADDNDAEAVRMLLERHEQLISRCALLLGFASILVAIVVFLAPDVPALPWVWERDLFYLSIFVWGIPTGHLLLSLRHEMPPPWEFGSIRHFDFVAGLYVRRLWLYNATLIATLVSYAVIFLLFVPVEVSRRPAPETSHQTPAAHTAKDAVPKSGK